MAKDIVFSLADIGLVILGLRAYNLSAKEIGWVLPKKAGLVLGVACLVGAGMNLLHAFFLHPVYKNLISYLHNGVVSIPRITILFNLGENFNSLMNTKYLLFMLILVPIREELLFRGLFFNIFRRKTNLWPAILLSSLFFAVAHYDIFAYADWTAWPLIIHSIRGIIYCILYRWSGSLAAPVTAHCVMNLLADGLSFEFH